MLGRKIYILRREAGLTQEELAKIVGTGRTTINGYEKDIISPPPEKLVKMADYFHVTVDYILGRSIERNDNQSKLFEADLKEQLEKTIELIYSNRELKFNGKLLTKVERSIIGIQITSIIEVLNELSNEKRST